MKTKQGHKRNKIDKLQMKIEIGKNQINQTKH